MPHGLSFDHEDNVWLTDVALHQAFKFSPGGGAEPLLTLGTELQPGTGTDHFCKPTDVAVDPETGNIYVADGYCNSRIVMFSASGGYMKEWGKASSYIGKLRIIFINFHKFPSQFISSSIDHFTSVW